MVSLNPDFMVYIYVRGSDKKISLHGPEQGSHIKAAVKRTKKYLDLVYYCPDDVTLGHKVDMPRT